MIFLFLSRLTLRQDKDAREAYIPAKTVPDDYIPGLADNIN